MNYEKEYIGFLDTTTVQNTANTVRTLYKPGTRNTIIKNTEKLKINAAGFLRINCNPILKFTENTRRHEMGKIFAEIILANTNSFKGKYLLTEALDNFNLTDKYIANTLKRKRDSTYEYREKN